MSRTLSTTRRAGVALALAIGLLPSIGLGADVPSASVAEARQRFDRGLALYNAGDSVGALAEFRRAHQLTGHAVVLFNLALVHASLGQAVEAVQALEKLESADYSALGPERAAQARRVHDEQRLRVGVLDVRSNVEHALVQIDGVDVARTPAPPLRVTAGAHLVGIFAPGYEPRRFSVIVAGRATERIDAELAPLAEPPAMLRISANVPDVEVRSGGQLLARTPLTGELALKAGSYDLEFTRPGYAPERRSVVLHSGRTSDLAVPLAPNPPDRATHGELTLSLSEPNSVVLVDGEPRLDPRGIRLPSGRHTLRVQRAGFFDVVRDVVVLPGSSRVVDVTLLPTPEYLGDYVGRARAQRTWSYIAFGAGAAVTAGSAAFLIWNHAEKQDAERAFDAYTSEINATGGECRTPECDDILNILVDDLDAKRDRDVYGWVGVGIGAAAIGAGVLLYTLGDDPARYDPSEESDVFASLGVSVSARAVGFSGSF